MALPKTCSDYSKEEYWNRRYEEEEEFDWFSTYETLKPLINDSINRNDSILVLGCGNSTLSAEMYRDGYHNIINVDYSKVVIENMSQKYKTLKEMKWKVMDIRNLDEIQQEFDVVLEKGTLDALLVNEKDPWFISAEVETVMNEVLLQISRHLKTGGRFISITFTQPHFRKPLYARPDYNWSIKTIKFGKHFDYFYYVMTKGEPLSETDVKLREQYKKQWEQPSTLECYPSSENEDYLMGISVSDNE